MIGRAGRQAEENYWIRAVARVTIVGSTPLTPDWGDHVRTTLLVATALITAALGAGPAAAEIQARVKVESGDTLGGIAHRYACPIDALQKQNQLRSTKIRAGQTIAVPRCGKPARPRVAKAIVAPSESPLVLGQSLGKPWRGALSRPAQLRAGKGYLIRRPLRSFGTRRLVDTVRNAVAAVRADHPKVHTLAIGDLSQKRGGEISEHRSHQSGRDVDVGFFYRKKPKGYPQIFVVGNASNLDLPATWDLLVAFARTADDRGGVQAIYLDYGLQGVLYEWARDRGVSATYLDQLFQYPNGKGSGGLVRHEPHHADHFHIRLRCPPGDATCS